MKNDLMMLDIIATNKWKRPLYFAASNSVNHCFNVDSFCLVQGWVYKFMPVKANPADYIPGMGGVDPLTSYDIFMNKCKWGNLNDPHVYVDPESLNNSVRPKTNMLRTAQSLVDMGKKQDALKIMNEYFKYFPDSKITYDMYVLPFAEIYFKAGDTTSAVALIRRISEIYDQNLDYYYSFKGKNREYYQEDIQTALGMIKRMSSIASQYQQPKLAAKLDSLFNLKLKSYQ
jgi:tetratricopeptide (TPR) repeat protein